MAETDVITTPPPEGSPDGTGSKATDKAGQPDGQPQDGGTPKVEGGEQHTSSKTSERPKASDFYAARKADKQWKQSIEGTLQQLSEQQREIGLVLKDLKKPSDEPKLLTEGQMQELLQNDPAKWAVERERQLRNEIQQTIKQVKDVEVPKIIQQNEDKKLKEQKAQQFETAKREALELLFPKSGTDDTSDLDERMEAQRDRYKRIDQLLAELGLDDVLMSDPVKAAKGVLRVLETEAKLQRANPGTTKAQMSGITPTGTPNSGGGSRTMTLKEVQAKRDEMEGQLEENPSLRWDEKWMAQRASLKSELAKKIEEHQVALGIR